MRRRGRPRHPDVLTPREQEVLALIRDDLSNEEIAARLGISIDGVKYHASEILGKLGVRNRREAAAWRPEERPWWQAALAPLALWRAPGRVALGAAAVVVIVLIAVLGALIWGIVATADGESQQAESAVALPTEPAAPTMEPAAGILTVRPFSETGAWLLTEEALLHTQDAGATWVDVTPPDMGRPMLAAGAASFFADDSFAWIATFPVSVGGVPPSITIWRTIDAGGSWTSRQFELPQYPGRQYAGGGSIFFLDRDTGWLEVGLQSGSAFRLATLFRTLDGGQTWTEVTIPTADPVLFTTPEDGWLAGGAALTELYASSDGGSSWQERTVPGPTAEHPWSNTVTLPHFFDPFNGVLGVQVRRDIAASDVLYFFQTRDGGATWSQAGGPLEIASAGDFFSGEPRRAAFIGLGHWLIAADRLYATIDAGETWSVVDPDLDTRPFTQIAFATLERGWGVWHNRDCSRDATTCSDTWRLLKTKNGGRTWSDVALP